MSQSSTSPLQTPPPQMKGKVIAAILAVIVGHVGVLWAVNQIKSPELPPIKKEPLKVKFVKIQVDEPPPPPPEPVVKPKVQPVEKPVKPKVEPKPVVKPKIIHQKKPVTDDNKAIKQEELKRLEEKKRLENQQRLEQQKRDQDAKDQAARDQAKRDQEAKDQAARDQAKRDQEEKDRLARQNQQPKKLSIGNIKWVKEPKPSYSVSELKGEPRSLTIYIEADENGNIRKDKVRIIKSSGISSLDRTFLSAVKRAKFQQYIQNGVAYPFAVEQPYDLTPPAGK